MNIEEVLAYLNQFVPELNIVVVDYDTDGAELVLPIKSLEYNKLNHRIEIIV